MLLALHHTEVGSMCKYHDDDDVDDDLMMTTKKTHVECTEVFSKQAV